MAIAKGQSDIKSERELVILGFDEQIDILRSVQYQQETIFKAQLVNLSSNSEIEKEEKLSIEKPLLEELQNIQERHVRMRKTILIGMYSFWELSLQSIMNLKSATNVDSTLSSPKDRQKSLVWNYLNIIYEGNIPVTSLDIDGPIRVLRNYLVHGGLSKNKLEQLKSFSEIHTDFHLCITNEGCYISNYDGLSYLLNGISKELNNAEVAVYNSSNNQN